MQEPAVTENTNTNEDDEELRSGTLRDLQHWLQEFRQNLVDESVPALRDAPASSSRESSAEPRGTLVSGKHSIYSHFPKDRNCDICLRTEITRASCRRRIGGAVPRADNFCDLMTADNNFLSEGCESRHNHRYAVVVQDLATQWIQLYAFGNKTFQETDKSLRKFLEQTRKSKVIYTHIFKNWANIVKIFPEIIVR